VSVFVNGCPRYTFRIGVAGKARLLHAQTASQVDSRFPPLCFPLLATNNKGTPKYRRFGSGASLFSEVLISAPPSDTPAKLTEANLKAERLRKAVRAGSSFADIAKANSQGPTAGQGGPIGCFKRGVLSKELEGCFFQLEAGEVSDVLHTKQGFVILQVTERSPR
jgi:hypothetical protein